MFTTQFPIIAMRSYLSSLYLIANNQEAGICVYLYSSTHGFMQYCQSMQKLYSVAGFVPEHLKNKGVLNDEEREIVNCRQLKTDEGLAKIKEASDFFKSSESQRKQLTGRASAGAIGSITKQTLDCLEIK